jgi:hypothetical protein
MASLFEQIIEIFWPQRKPAPPQPSPSPPKAPEKPTVVKNGRNPIPIEHCRKWRLTEYYLASQEDHPSGEMSVPILDKLGKEIGKANAAFFSSLALEGSGITEDGRLVNVAGTWVKCDPERYQAVWDYHKKYLSKRSPSYSGLQVVDDKVMKVLAFYEVPHDKFGKGFGMCHDIPLDPYRTLAADIGKGKKSDPKFISGGGVVPLGSEVYIHELNGLTLPDGSKHDGWCTVNDTGGGIFGAHFDVFIGHHDNESKFRVPSVGHIWFEGIEKLSNPYTYGLVDA